ncbi:hypothetical protein ACQ4M4_10325 [Leptolyngbya sp. AN02str]|uniref:hypothetical protein n=1 Tax=Leptolyngbya sp. AN02str TaxID=3423363 RepID=UPI003D31D1E4
MHEPCFREFYRGWMIEIELEADAYRGVGYSPARLCLSTERLYTNELLAISTLKGLIDRHIACRQVSLLLRDLYESEKIAFDEWRSLTHSLAS